MSAETDELFNIKLIDRTQTTSSQLIEAEGVIEKLRTDLLFSGGMDDDSLNELAVCEFLTALALLEQAKHSLKKCRLVNRNS